MFTNDKQDDVEMLRQLRCYLMFSIIMLCAFVIVTKSMKPMYFIMFSVNPVYFMLCYFYVRINEINDLS